VITACSGGVLDHVIEGETGLMFDPEDQRDLIEAVSRLIGDKRYARRLGTTARTLAKQRSWTTVMDGLLTDYAELISRRIVVPFAISDARQGNDAIHL
jgi:phosphatidylinositol alpha 1,6-mannosyltransferase